MSTIRIRRGLVAACLACAAVPAAQAVMLDQRGLGQVLVYPYYTVNSGQDTLLTILNTADVGKAVHVAFREAYNGRETLTFNLFLSPHDAWSAAVSTIDGSAGSGARLLSSDSSCVQSLTYPAPFTTTSFDANAPAPSREDTGPTTPARTREGMLEVIALGDIVPGSPTAIAITPAGSTGEGARSCNLPEQVATDLVAPTGGLAGSGAIANVGEGTFYTYAADALVGFTPSLLWTGTATAPDLSSARSSASQFPDGAIASVSSPSGDALALDYENAIDAVSAVFMADSIYNEFVIGAALGANTDWVVTFPTRQFYVDKARYPGVDVAPFVEPFGATANGESRVSASTESMFDREGASAWPPAGNCGSPIPCPSHVATFGHQVGVLAFADAGTSGVFGSRLAVPPMLASAWDSFWTHGDTGALTLDLAHGDGQHRLRAGTTGDGVHVQLAGLPVTGFMAYNVINTQAAPGRLANYGGTFRHRSRARCTSDADAGDPCQ
ncbi:hypothetical protein [Dokdonella fugitiva]|uniref:Uncharacterized protein n=1 Tax=Dokdonella fugitiva TaxID=328517 RepID=A0A4R2IDM4_9GAMM|nr:hypothetical protein [Dokdonella fugitiva]TCO42684.1 hypothetical protein EV148_10190 [Dokdonella fugitiva]